MQVNQSRIKSINRSYFLLAILSIILLLWNHYGMEKVVQLFPSDDITLSKMDDSINEGQSITKIERQSDQLQLSCQTINVEYTHAFCGVALELPQAMDLNDYESVVITLSKESDVKDTTLVYLINAEPESNNTLKERLNLRTIYVGRGSTTFELPLETFNIPSWWLLANHLDEFQGEPKFNRIVKVAIVSGDSTVERTELITINEISLKGKMINSSLLQAILMVFWIVLISVHLGFIIRRQMQVIAYSKEKASSLEKLNSVLNIEKNKFESLAKTDPLTGILNRAGLRPYLGSCIKNYSRERSSSSLIVFDIDHFKLLNDEFGHLKGDEVLRLLCEFVTTLIRQDDAFARWGGEEFVIVCQDNNIREAEGLANKLCKRIANATFSDLNITCSFGVSSLNGEGVRNWIERADQAMYAAKENGRNQVKSAD